MLTAVGSWCKFSEVKNRSWRIHAVSPEEEWKGYGGKDLQKNKV